MFEMKARLRPTSEWMDGIGTDGFEAAAAVKKGVFLS